MGQQADDGQVGAVAWAQALHDHAVVVDQVEPVVATQQGPRLSQGHADLDGIRRHAAHRGLAHIGVALDPLGDGDKIDAEEGGDVDAVGAELGVGADLGGALGVDAGDGDGAQGQVLAALNGVADAGDDEGGAGGSAYQGHSFKGSLEATLGGREAGARGAARAAGRLRLELVARSRR